MTFDDAVAHVRAAASESVAAYAFIPTVRRGAVAGGAIYAVAWDARAGAGEDPVLVEYMAGTFGTGDGDVDAYAVDEVPEEALDLDYEPVTTYDPTLTGYDTAVALAVLRGATLDAALDELTAGAAPAGPNATPEALTADLLVAHGFPAVLPTPAGPLPAAVVLLDADDRRLAQLLDALGGVVITAVEPPAGRADDADDEEAPAAPAAEVVGSTDDREQGDDEGDDEGDEVAEAAWVGVGRGGVLAAVLATRALPEWTDDVHPDFAEAWRAMVAYAGAAADAPPDAAGRRPKAVYQELRRLAAKVERLVARQIDGHDALMSGLAAAVAAEAAAGTFDDADFVLPSRAELDAPVPLPGMPPANADADTPDGR